MSHTRLWTSAAIIAGVILLGFVLSVPHTRDIPRAAEPAQSPQSAPAVTVHDSFKKGVHTITGSLIAPNSCTKVTAAASVDTSGILVALSMPEDTEVCLQMPSRVNYSATVTANASLPIRATVNGVAATTTVS